MAMMQGMEDEIKKVMDSPQDRAKIEQLAKDKGIPMIEAARQHLADKKSNQ